MSADSRSITVDSIGPGVTIQDGGRPGLLSVGLSRGGAADVAALREGAVLLGQSADLAALELAGMGGKFRASCDLRLALTGAPMVATLEGQPLRWNAAHHWPAGTQLSIGAARTGVYGYLHLGGGLDTPLVLGARSAHLAGGVGRPVAAGDTLPVGPDPNLSAPAQYLPVPDRCSGGVLRIVASAQTDLFTQAERARFTATVFTRDPRGNRQGVRLAFDGAPFAVEGGLNILSEIVVPGDVQVTGDGSPFVLLGECQTTGGYPRIGTVLPVDLPRVAQAAPGTALQFQFVSLAEGLAITRAADAATARLSGQLARLIRDPHDIRDLLSYQLIGGVTAGHELNEEPPKP
ncbi:biotin-dependent carboxyltransferase family protein [Pseudoruegeria sp. SK021]|uniref:5-oxoprolinase subunit C family protein n=1 Tax=Pseudoruegeria sp. SK021 TaxID=1933035 RepID=UPI000A237ED5|nr:biotin-dependent carboxyltransferase family protein [Pseudoruegeria sp. SK021]OSP54043.1 urea amidolyase [Pseudoruegeria sp. SK021]